jgi:Winged helix DNA-binding domain
MKEQELIRHRLQNQQLSGAGFASPADAVERLGAMQAQDYLGALWSVGQRMKKAVEADVERAIADRSIVRTWPMRGTLHFVLPQNARWMLSLLTQRVLARAQGNYRSEGLDKTTFTKSKKIFEKVLEGGKPLTRDEMYEALRNGKIKLGGQRGLHLINHAAQEALICMGPRQGKQHTFVLVDEWIPQTEKISADESLVKLARMYFSGHGPATIADFVWWTGLTMTEAKKAIDMIQVDLQKVIIEDQTYWMTKEIEEKKWNSPHVALLSWFDEYVIAYKDRSAAFDPATKKFIQNPKNGIYTAVILIDGKIAGNWKRTFVKGKVNVEVKPFRTYNKKEKTELDAVIQKYSRFVGVSQGIE